MSEKKYSFVVVLTFVGGGDVIPCLQLEISLLRFIHIHTLILYQSVIFSFY